MLGGLPPVAKRRRHGSVWLSEREQEVRSAAGSAVRACALPCRPLRRGHPMAAFRFTERCQTRTERRSYLTEGPRWDEPSLRVGLVPVRAVPQFGPALKGRMIWFPRHRAHRPLPRDRPIRRREVVRTPVSGAHRVSIGPASALRALPEVCVFAPTPRRARPGEYGIVASCARGSCG
jgi:hypothetical protein